jgi:snurportin-1
MSALEARAAQHRTSARLDLHQDRRRAEALRRQKDARSDRSNRARQLLEPEAPIEVDALLTKAQRKKQRAWAESRKRAERWSSEVCGYDWLVDVPQDLNGAAMNEGWFAVPRAEGRRVVLVAAKGKVEARQTSGDRLHQFSCDCLPGGSLRTKRDGSATILDCVFVEHSQTFVIMDAMCWAGYALYDCAAEFRFYWLRTKLAEAKAESADDDAFRIDIAPYFDCNRRGLRNAYEAPLPYLRDGLLFYHKQGFYETGHTALVALFKDEHCTRRFNADASGALVAALRVAGTTARTVDGVAFAVVGDLDPVLREGELARFVVVSDGAAVTVRPERRCSPKRAVADCASKLAFFLRRRAGGGLAFGDLLAAAGAV